jgi:hypothetical protein
MRRFKSLLIAAPVAAGLLAAPAAHAEWRGHGGYGWHGGYGHYHGGWRGPGVAGALLGLGAAAVVGGVIASQAYAPPPVVYAPPPGYYAPPPAYYAAPPGYYPPGY